MKISELIALLEKMKGESGDLEVLLDCDMAFYEKFNIIVINIEGKDVLAIG